MSTTAIGSITGFAPAATEKRWALSGVSSSDPAGWAKLYFDDPIEPIDLVPNGNRAISSATIAGKIGCSPATITRACTRFREMAGLDSNGAVHCIRPDAGSNGDNPAAVRV